MSNGKGAVIAAKNTLSPTGSIGNEHLCGFRGGFCGVLRGFVSSCPQSETKAGGFGCLWAVLGGFCGRDRVRAGYFGGVLGRRNPLNYSPNNKKAFVQSCYPYHSCRHSSCRSRSLCFRHDLQMLMAYYVDFLCKAKFATFKAFWPCGRVFYRERRENRNLKAFRASQGHFRWFSILRLTDFCGCAMIFGVGTAFPAITFRAVWLLPRQPFHFLEIPS